MKNNLRAHSVIAVIGMISILLAGYFPGEKFVFAYDVFITTRSEGMCVMAALHFIRKG